MFHLLCGVFALVVGLWIYSCKESYEPNLLWLWRTMCAINFFCFGLQMTVGLVSLFS